MQNLNKGFNQTPVEPQLITYIHEKAGKFGVPVSGNFELTSRCNFNCKMCYIHNRNSVVNDELPAEEWIEIGRQAVENGMSFLLLTGGEPLIRKDFSEIYSGLKKLGLMISINTNASLLCGDILELFKREPPVRLNISLYGFGDETYKALCENECFSKVKNNIENSVEYGLPVRLNCSITPYNFCDIEKIYSFAKELNLNVKSSSYMYPQIRLAGDGFGKNSCRFTPEQAAENRFRSELLYLGKNRFTKKAKSMINSVEQGGLFPEKLDNCMHCRAGKSNFWIDWQGNMSMCGMIPSSGYNVLQNGFLSCWEAVKNERKNVRLPHKCIDCKFAPVCSVCAAICRCETGSYEETPKYVCEFTEDYYKRIVEYESGINGRIE